MRRQNNSLWLLEQEARALLTRLSRIKSFALYETAVPAASVSPSARAALERSLSEGRRELRDKVHSYLKWLNSSRYGQQPSAENAQKRFTFLRLRFNAVLSQFDIFADALTQRSENETGIWLSGLDSFAIDALAKPGFYSTPALMCYLDRGAGAAIRRARTRLPGGGQNPVAVIRIPRERMIGSGIGSSLVHEVGHQGAALLDLVNSLRSRIRQMHDSSNTNSVWSYWDRWISEIIADLWSVSHLAIGSSLGLMGVVSLPRAFVFRVSEDDPHPIPWIRVKLSCAMGNALYPNSQWMQLAELWESYYPTQQLAPAKRLLLARLEAAMPDFIALLLDHHAPRLLGHSVYSLLHLPDRQKKSLTTLFKQWEEDPSKLYKAQPTLVFAVIGQARIDNQISPEYESDVVAKMLSHWALKRALESDIRHENLEYESSSI